MGCRINGERPSVVKVRDSDLFLCRVMYQGCHLFSQSCLFGETLKENNIKCHVAYIQDIRRTSEKAP